MTVPGGVPAISRTLIAELPEIGTLDRHGVAALGRDMWRPAPLAVGYPVRRRRFAIVMSAVDGSDGARRSTACGTVVALFAVRRPAAVAGP